MRAPQYPPKADVNITNPRAEEDKGVMLNIPLITTRTIRMPETTNSFVFRFVLVMRASEKVASKDRKQIIPEKSFDLSPISKDGLGVKNAR
jgi:hypothetical protein